ncbi:MAG: hypothetical protein LW688_04290 [Cryomorphaceae bacterium]|jgi:hypothetical protein|nr:hypothetical protein [Cryomorphaceae bacterium]
MKFLSPNEAIRGCEDSRYLDQEENDCVVRAMALAFGFSYDEAHGFTRGIFKRQDGEVAYNFTRCMKTVIQDSQTFFEGSIKQFKVKKGLCAGQMQKLYPNNTFLVGIEGHVSIYCCGTWIDYEDLVFRDSVIEELYIIENAAHLDELKGKLVRPEKFWSDPWLYAVVIGTLLLLYFLDKTYF